MNHMIIVCIEEVMEEMLHAPLLTNNGPNLFLGRLRVVTTTVWMSLVEAHTRRSFEIFDTSLQTANTG